MRKAKKIRSLKSKINALMLKKVKKYVKNVISEAFNVIRDKNDFLEESTIKCFSWNVRTLSLIEDGYKSINSLHNDRFSLLAKDMRSKNIDIGGLQEVRRPNSGLDESGDYILYWSGL